MSDLAASEVRSGSEQIYPGSHELRLLRLIQVESPLVPEGMLVLASLERKPLENPGYLSLNEKGQTPEQTLRLLSELAEAIFDQVKQSKTGLTRIGLQNEPSQC